MRSERVSYRMGLERLFGMLPTLLLGALALSLTQAATKAEIEDIYLPYKPKRRTRAMIARENGLGPLAEAILAGQVRGRMVIDPNA